MTNLQLGSFGSFIVALIALLPQVGYAQPLTAPSLFRGAVGGASVDLIVLSRGGDVLAASYRPEADRDARWDTGWDLPLTPARLLTGTREGRRLRLREWRGRDDESATVVADIFGRTLSGTWRERGAAKPVRFSLRLDPDPLGRLPWERSNMANVSRAYPSVVDRLHVAIRTERWADAAFEAQLLCVVTFALPMEDGCGWIDAVAALAEGREPPSMVHAAWAGLVLERAGQHLQAFETYRDRCWTTRSACAFMIDLLDRIEPEKRRAALALACKHAGIGCDAYWGANEVALVRAARRGNLAEVDRLLKGAVNANAGEGALLTPLQSAVLARSLPIVKALLNYGADPNHPAQSWFGMPLDYAVSHSFDDIALWLVEHGAKANAGDALVTAVGMRKRVIVKRILENGEHPDEKYAPAGSALMMAVENRDLELVRELVRHGADPDFSTNFSDGSPLDLARRTGQQAILQVLIAGRKSGR